MFKESLERVIHFLRRYWRLMVAILVMVVTAVVVVLLLKNRAGNEDSIMGIVAAGEEETQTDAPEISPEDLEVPLEVNSNDKVEALIEKYYLDLSTGDVADLSDICDVITETESFRLEEQSKYLAYEIEDIYVQNGPEEGSFIAYVYCMVVFDDYPDVKLPAYNGFYIKSDEEGNLGMVRGELSNAENEYIQHVASLDDVVELNNRITVEYNDVIREHPELLEYLSDLDVVVSTAVGERLAALNAPETAGETSENAQTEEQTAADVTVLPADETVYGTATTTVNVRSSDSQNADKLGKVSIGTKLEVLAVQMNGWTKVKYDGEVGYIKSEYLSTTQSAKNATTIGTVTATTTVNVRAEASQDANRIGALASGESLDLVAIQDGWCTVKYSGVLAYIIADYVTYTLN